MHEYSPPINFVLNYPNFAIYVRALTVLLLLNKSSHNLLEENAEVDSFQAQRSKQMWSLMRIARLCLWTYRRGC